MDKEPTRRFSDRVADYVRYRPGYPPALVPFLREHMGLSQHSVIADIGSGTGILSRMLLERGHTVYGVEPNEEMRTAAEELLRGFPGFTSIAGAAESTGLPAACADFVMAAQAFHWFRTLEARAEFRRILRAPGWIVLIWNTRDDDRSPLLRAYEDVLQRYGVDYREIDHRKARDPRLLSDFFGAGGWQTATFPNEQVLDWTGLRGRVLSASYAPKPGHPSHDPMMGHLRRIFEEHQRNGLVRLEYDTEVFYGRLA